MFSWETSVNASIGSYGDVVFQVFSGFAKTFENYSRTSRAVYADHQVVIGKPASEFTGEDLDEISFDMHFNATLGVSPAAEADKLREMLSSGKAHMLLVGNKPIGYYTLREVSEAVTHTLRGAPVVSTVTVSLVECVFQPSPAAAAAQSREAARG